MLPTTGSTITPAILVAVLGKGRFQAGRRRCIGSTSVSRAVPAVTPGELGTPSVAAELPAATSRLSTWPW